MIDTMRHFARSTSPDLHSALRGVAREAEREAFVEARYAELTALSHPALVSRARGHALPIYADPAELARAVAMHECGSELTVRWADEDLA